MGFSSLSLQLAFSLHCLWCPWPCPDFVYCYWDGQSLAGVQHRSLGRSFFRERRLCWAVSSRAPLQARVCCALGSALVFINGNVLLGILSWYLSVVSSSYSFLSASEVIVFLLSAVILPSKVDFSQVCLPVREHFSPNPPLYIVNRLHFSKQTSYSYLGQETWRLCCLEGERKLFSKYSRTSS